jgi:hypothetical protein
MRSGCRSVVPVLLLLPALTFAAPAPAAAQAPATSASPVIVPTPAADPADVASIDAIVAALYDVISGPQGQKRNWNRMRSLFLPGGRLMPVGPRQAGGNVIRVMEVNDYIALSGEQLEAMGFREREIANRTERFGNIAHVFSTYEGFRGDESQPFLRGINSIQLMYDGTRWWIVSVFWEAERPDNPLPEAYLRSGGR